MKFLQLLSIIFIFAAAIFPTVIFGIECDVGGICYPRVGRHSHVVSILLKTKTCEDACVRFKCAIYNDTYFYMDGAGCYEDFVNACKHVPTKVKDEIKANLKNYSLRIRNLAFRSCSDKDRCAKSDAKNWKYDKTLDGEIYVDLLEKDVCNYDDTPNPSYPKSKCSNRISCESGSSYRTTLRSPYFVYGAEKECDACLNFKCTNDGGNTVIEGNGCWEDFVHACPTVPDDVKENIKKNIKNSFHANKTYSVTSCSNNKEKAGDCKIDFSYEMINFKMHSLFISNINRDHKGFCDATLLPSTTTTTTRAPEIHLAPTEAYVGSNGQTNVFKFHGILIIVFGFILIYLF